MPRLPIRIVFGTGALPGGIAHRAQLETTGWPLLTQGWKCTTLSVHLEGVCDVRQRGSGLPRFAGR